MKIKKYGWAIWNKKIQKFVIRNGAIIYSNKEKAWLIADKCRKGTPYKLVKIILSANNIQTKNKINVKITTPKSQRNKAK